MNQRLKELTDKATYDILGVPVLDSERLARLIVQECVDIARAGLNPAVAQVIQNRFGVDHAKND